MKASSYMRDRLSTSRASVTGRLLRSSAALLLATLCLAGIVHAQSWNYRWDAADAGGYGQGTGYVYSYSEGLQAVRALLYRGTAPLWQFAAPSEDPALLVNKNLPKDGYAGNIAGVVAGTPDALCAQTIPLICANCAYTGRKVSWAIGVDHWRCEIVQPQTNGPPSYWLGASASPHCGQPGYSWSNWGYFSNFPPYRYPASVCFNPAYARIKPVGFNAEKCANSGGCGPLSVGNPINAALGTKTHRETVYRGASPIQPLDFEWVYASNGPDTLVKRAGWGHRYGRAIATVIGSTNVLAYRASGEIARFALTSGVYLPDLDINDRLTRLVDGGGNTTGWLYYASSVEETETYDSVGRLISIQERNGAVISLSYSTVSTAPSVAPAPGLLIQVADSFGRTLGFTYDALSQLATMTDPAGATYGFGHDVLGNLTSITYPGGAVRTFHYENPTYENALTGISDENGTRFATYGYDTHGRAISTQHAGGADSYALVYNANGTTTVTDPLGTTRTIGFVAPRGAIRTASVNQPCAHCGVNSSAISYDANGNTASRTDFNGKKACFAYDLARNLETARVEGALSTETCSTVLSSPPDRPDVRKVTTAWNAGYRLPATVSEPAPGGSKTTSYAYDASGNLTQKSVVAPTNDGSGSTVTRSWSWTYGTLGRVLTATDPNGKVTNYTYHPDNDPSRR